MSELTPYGQWLRDARLEAGLSLRELADLAQTTFGTIDKLEHARIQPSVTLTTRICVALGYDPWTVIVPFAVVPRDVASALYDAAQPAPVVTDADEAV